jgi:hypothetical protein
MNLMRKVSKKIYNKLLIIKSFWKFLSSIKKITFCVSAFFTLIFIYYLNKNGLNNISDKILLISVWFPFSYIIEYIEDFNKYSNDLKELRMLLSSLIDYYNYDIKKFQKKFPLLKIMKPL